MTIEDPIEYIFDDDKAFINQREIGIDVKNFHAALKYLMREDPDVVLVGEFGTAIRSRRPCTRPKRATLCLGTIHASSTAQTITRISGSCSPKDALADPAVAGVQPQAVHLPEAAARPPSGAGPRTVPGDHDHQSRHSEADRRGAGTSRSRQC